MALAGSLGSRAVSNHCAGKRSALKGARSVWKGGKTVKSYLSLPPKAQRKNPEETLHNKQALGHTRTTRGRQEGGDVLWPGSMTQKSSLRFSMQGGRRTATSPSLYRVGVDLSGYCCHVSSHLKEGTDEEGQSKISIGHGIGSRFGCCGAASSCETCGHERRQG